MKHKLKKALLITILLGSSLFNIEAVFAASGFSVGGNGNLTINNSYTLPNADGTTNQILQTDGNGHTTWTTLTETLSTFTDNGDGTFTYTAEDGSIVTIGTVGATGPQGPAGNDGAVGATGAQGPVGNDGAVGDTGVQGPTGPTSPTKSTYSVWGTTVCATGHTQLYTGTMSIIRGVAATSGSEPLCLNPSVTNGWINWDKSLTWRAKAGAGSNRGQYISTGPGVDCAVCQGEVYVNWGAQSCASGWNTAYDGFIGGMASGNSSGAWSVNGPLCLANIQAGDWTNWEEILVVRAGGGNSTGSRVQYQNDNDMLCRVCY